MKCVAVLVLSFVLGSQCLPFDDQIAGTLNNTGFPCFSKYCRKPTMKYERILNVKPRTQWDDAGGYCGSMAIQNVALGKGVWISQQQVRDHTVPGGGHDSEILETNVEQALTNLKLQFEGFDYKHQPVPQADAYRGWIKKHLAAGNGVAWMIMLAGGHYPVYPSLPYGFYSHVEPVLGVLSNQPLSAPWDPTDVLVHGTDASTHSYYRTFDSLPADVTSRNVSECGEAYLGYPCIYKDYGFGWAVTGVQDPVAGAEVSLDVDETSEPDTRSGASAGKLQGTVQMSALVQGSKYELYRWDDVASAFNYTAAKMVHSFTAAGQSNNFVDPTPIVSSGVTYYRCIPAK